MSDASLDPIRYGLRALEVLARAEASVLLPPPTHDLFFRPHPTLRAPARDGAALSLRMFSPDEDATDFVLRATDQVQWTPAPPRAAALFEAHAAAIATDGDEELVVGFPLVSFVQKGVRRTAPLLSWSGARAVWRTAEGVWKLPPRARTGAALVVPTELRLVAPAVPDDDTPTITPHGGVWSALFDLDPAVWAELPRVAKRDVGALARAATRLLTIGTEDALDDAAVEPGPLTREDLRALCEAVRARAAPRHGAQCHPHGLAMLLPRGDPTSGLRAELHMLEDGRPPSRGPLAVYLGATRADAQPGMLVSCGPVPPTPSQVRAAERFEGSSDLVAVCGPPGCGKTTLLHHLAAHAIVDCALGEGWTQRPGGTIHPWPLVIASTNNTAVDHALAPFTRGRELPVGLRVGNRRSMAEATAAALRDAVVALERTDGPSLPTARAAFEARGRAVREQRAAHHAAREARSRHFVERVRLDDTIETLQQSMRAPTVAVPDGVTADAVRRARQALKEHLDAIAHVAPKCLDTKHPSVEKAQSRWADANERRGPRIEPTLRELGIDVPYGPLPAEGTREALGAQQRAMEQVAVTLDAVLDALAAPKRQRELDVALAARARLDDLSPLPPSPLDPSLVALALDVRDAWARSHRAKLLPAMRDAIAMLQDDASPTRGGSLPALLASLVPLFPVAGCTLLSMRAAFVMAPGVIDRIVIDEAGQCAPVYAIPALARAKRALCTGDTAQLPPVYTLGDAVDARLADGLSSEAVAPFRMATSSTTSTQSVAALRTREDTLVEHFRSQPAIVALASSWSGYHLDVRTPPRSLTETSPRLTDAVIVEHVRGRGARAPDGIVNEPEVDRALAWVRALLGDGVLPSDLAVLTPFVGQSLRIERALRAQGLTEPDGVMVKTVHKLQGGERRVVVFSVVATEARHLRWLRDRPHLLHVATSRAQDHLIVLANLDVARHEPALAPLVRLHTA